MRRVCRVENNLFLFISPHFECCDYTKQRRSLTGPPRSILRRQYGHSPALFALVKHVTWSLCI